MTLYLQADHLETIRTQAELTYPEECCGLLLGTMTSEEKRVYEIWPSPNTWDQSVATDLETDLDLGKTRRYWIDPKDFLAAIKHGRSRNWEVIGIYHSHPDHPAAPSECDRRLAWSQYSYLIVSVQTGQMQNYASWVLDEEHQFQPEAIDLQDVKINRQASQKLI